MRERPEVQVRPLGPEHVARAGAVLGRAFADNPGYRAILRHLSDADRRAVVPRVKHAFADAAVRYGEPRGAWVGETLVGASLVLAPGQYPWPLGGFLAMGRGTIQWKTLGAVGRFLAIDAWMSKRHPKEPHYYLFVIGVEPDRQGQGIGKALLSELDARADARGVPCWLETDKEENLRIYERHGYRVVHEQTVKAAGDLHMWTMRRAPRR